MESLNPNIEIALQEAIQAEREERTGEREGFYASSLGMCPRKLICERAGIKREEPPDQRSVFKMWVGTILHREAQKLLEKSGYLDPAWTEKRLVYRSVVCKLDGVTHRINGSANVELKTTDDRAITKSDIPEHYLWQMMLGCLASGFSASCLFMLGKSQGLSKHRVIHLTDEWRKKIDDEITSLDALWLRYKANGEIPPCQHRYSWEDAYCPYGQSAKLGG